MNAKNRRNVFISSWARDEEAIATVAKFVENLGLKPVTVLDKRPEQRTNNH